MVNDNTFWDVRLISEIKDNLVGTPEGQAYEDAVEQGLRKPDEPDDPTSEETHSMVSTAYLVTQGKHFKACKSDLGFSFF